MLAMSVNNFLRSMSYWFSQLDKTQWFLLMCAVLVLGVLFLRGDSTR